MNHKPGVVASQKKGTLRLSEDAHGLRVEADLFAPEHRSLLRQAARGELRGSFKGGFRTTLSRPPLRRKTVEYVRLDELSLMTRGKRPAYRTTWFGIDTDENRARMERCRHDAVDRQISELEAAC